MKIFYKKEEMEENMIIFHRIGWKELSYYHKNPPKISFPKGIDTYNKYKLHLLKIKKYNNDPIKILLNRLFKNNSELFTIIDADFPYFTSEYITHKILWFNPKKIKRWINNDFVEKILKTYFPNRKIYFFENKFNNRSITKIQHFHFFINNIPKNQVL
jgi:hypothetical protein